MAVGKFSAGQMRVKRVRLPVAGASGHLVHVRIVSLLASGTEIVAALDLDRNLVGISHECDYPPSVTDRPRVSHPRFDPAGLASEAIDAAVRETMERAGAVYRLDTDLLRELAPDLLIAQAVCEVCAVPTSLARDAAEALGGDVRVVSLDSHTVEDVLHSIELVGEAAGVADRAASLGQRLRGRLSRVTERVRRLSRPTVLALEWLAPPFVPGHWTPEMVELAGGTNLLASAWVPSRQVTWSDMDALDPDVLLVLPCGYDLAAARADADRHAMQLVAAAPRAVERGNAWVLDGSAYFNRSGPRMVDGLEVLAAILHPECRSEYDIAGRAEPWRP